MYVYIYIHKRPTSIREGKYDFNIDDSTDPTKIVFELSVPKYLETGQLDVDVKSPPY